jgi:hypothetical protein
LTRDCAAELKGAGPAEIGPGESAGGWVVALVAAPLDFASLVGSDDDCTVEVNKVRAILSDSMLNMGLHQPPLTALIAVSTGVAWVYIPTVINYKASRISSKSMQVKKGLKNRF